MFNFCIVLTAAPFYVLAQNETDLEEVLLVYKDNVSVIIKANNLEAMDFKMQMSISSKNTLLLPKNIDESAECILKMVSESEKDDLIQELINDVEWFTINFFNGFHS